MGGTFPVLVSFFVRKKEDTGRDVGLLYALNTVGAMAGVLFSGFYALYVLGVWQTVFLAASFNLMICFLCFRLSPRSKKSVLPVSVASAALISSDPKASSSYVPNSFVRSALMILFGLSGAVRLDARFGYCGREFGLCFFDHACDFSVGSCTGELFV